MITVKTLVNAPIELVWECWTQPEHIVHWNFASEDWQCPSASNPLVEGEKFSWRMEAKDGSMGFDFWGTYTRIEFQSALEYTLGDGRLVRIQFEENQDGIELTESFETEGTNSDEMQRAGWQAILNNFKKHVESQI